MTDRRWISDALIELAAVAADLGDTAAADEAAAIRERVEQQRFVVACVGHFKRGKSTLINALLADPVLPAGVTPVTAVPTVVRFGRRRAARVRDKSGLWRDVPVESLADYVAEERNQGNAKGITAAEVLEPADLLANGLCLVDTPGLGSVFDAGGRATLDLVPHIDVALAVIGADPPLTGDELRLIESAARQASHVLVVLNKADRMPASERREARDFAKGVIERAIGVPTPAVLEVSAKDRLEGRALWPDWERLVVALRELAATAGARLSLGAGRRALARLGARLAARIDRTTADLTAPIEASQERVTRLAECVTSAARNLDDLAPVLVAQEHRLVREFSAAAAGFRSQVASAAHARLETRLSAIEVRFGPVLRARAMAAAQDVARDVIGEWLPDARRRADAAFRDSMRRFAGSVEEGWHSLREVASVELRQLVDVDEVASVAASEDRFYFNEQIAIAQPASPLRRAADVVLAAAGLRRLILSDAHRFLDWLLDVNVGRAESHLVERLRAGRSALADALRSALAALRDDAQSELRRVSAVRDAGAEVVATELGRLAALRRRLDAVRAAEPCRASLLSAGDPSVAPSARNP